MSSSLQDLALELGISVEELEAAAAKAAKKQAAAIERASSTAIEPKKSERWTDAEVAERWLEEEADLADGVHGIGGQTAGGIFGDHPIATPVYDPSSIQRGEVRAERRVTIEVLGQLTNELRESREQNRKLLEEIARGRLPEARRRRLR